MTLVKEFHRVLEKEFHMTLVQEFHQNAQQCLEMAERAGDPLTRNAWRRLAEKWQRLERHEVEEFDRSMSH
jgi:hypothetical protein